MKAESLKISKVFNVGGDVHYVLPHFQREYAWEKENWQTLLNDVMGVYDVYDPEKVPEHFMGALVVIQSGTQNGVVPVFRLVDGQQRLTTISLMLCALGQIITTSHPSLYKRIRRLLTNPDESDHLFFKLLPTTKYGDREAYLSLLNEKPFPDGIDSKIPESYRFFFKEFETKMKHANIDPERLFLVLANSLQVVFITLDAGERPYEIFESLNHKGKLLSQADLVRNYIAMKLPENRQNEIFEKYWSKIENLLQEKRTVGRSGLGEMTAFLRHYLTFRNELLCNEEHVYERFRDRIEGEFSSQTDFEQEIATLKNFAECYDRLLRPENEPDERIRVRLRRLNTLEISTAYPFLLVVYNSFVQGKINKNDFIDGLSIIENYIVRRYLTHEPTNYLNKMFPILWRELAPTQFVESLRKVIVTKNYPSDNRIKREIITLPLYDKRSQTREKIVLILESINRHLSTQAKSGGYTILDDSATVEHILPQSPSSDWKKYLGEALEDTYEYLHTIGNLTLVTQEWNSELSNAPFRQKKERLSKHELRLNSEYFSRSIEKWDESSIQARANFMIDAILSLWPELGVPPLNQKAVGTKPQSLQLFGQPFSVASWRDVAFFTAKTLSEIVDDFDSRIALQLPAYFDKERFQGACRQLPNSWWIYLNLSGVSVKSLCRNMISLAGFSEDEIQIEEI
jgi:uncharacterized protein with ParB-like and HNH nuclease domain